MNYNAKAANGNLPVRTCFMRDTLLNKDKRAVTKMTLSELYEAVGGDLNKVVERLGDRETVAFFVLGFPDDPSYSMLMRGLQDHDSQRAFHAAHTLKGVSLSLGFQALGDCATTLCEELRKGIPPAETLLQQLIKEYNRVITVIHYLIEGS